MRELESLLRCIEVAVGNHLQSARDLRHRHQRHHALDALQPRLTKGVLVEMQTFGARRPSAVKPPRAPKEHAIHRDDELLSLPNLCEGALHTRPTAHRPSTCGLCEPRRDAGLPTSEIPRMRILP